MIEYSKEQINRIELQIKLSLTQVQMWEHLLQPQNQQTGSILLFLSCIVNTIIVLLHLFEVQYISMLNLNVQNFRFEMFD